MWLFFGRKRRKAARSKDSGSAAVRPVAEQTNTTQWPRRGPSQRQRRRRASSRSTTASMDVEKNPPDPAFAKEAWPQSSNENITALPIQKRLEQSPHLRPITQEHTGIPYDFHSHSHSSLPPSAKDRGRLQRPQSMRRDPPTDSSLIHRKSSKRRKEHDHVREEEIRAMSLPMPQKRPAGNSGGMLRRDSKKVKGGLNHRFERPTSNVSLPLEDSIHSSMSGNSTNRAFRVSALDMFSPRPTIRVSVGSNYHSVERSSPNTYSEKSPRRERRPISSSDDRASKRSSRIDDLADDLDAGALRDILERDSRRREKKAKADQERLRRRLERRAEKQKATEVRGTSGTPRREGTGVVGLGIEREAPMPMEDVRLSTPPPQPQRLEMPVTPRAQDVSQLPTPLDSPTEEPVVSDARAIRYSRGSVSAQVHTRGPSNASVLPELISEKIAHDTPVESVEHVHDPTRSGSLHPVDTVDTFATSKQGSSTRRPSSEGRRIGVFASLFRRGKRKSQDQARPTPSEISFSNTSRESMSRQPLPVHLVATAPPTQPIQIRRPSSVPRRTMSKFREDLPEFPLSPPDSRVQSPEVPSTSIIAARRRNQHPSDLRVGSLPGDRSDSPVSPTIGNVMSQSLASVDSEGSWLSGRPPKRASNKSQIRSSLTSSAVPQNEDFSASYEELGMADDEYFNRLTPRPDDRGRSPYASDDRDRKASSTLMALDDAAEFDQEIAPTPAQTPGGEPEELVQSSVGRQPTIIHRRPRVKSTEGLLSMFLDDTGDRSSMAAEMQPQTPETSEADSPTSPTSDAEPVLVQRAESVNLGKNHVRHLSAGSAKLLDIQRRSSTPVHGRSHSRMSEQE
jgi:hypothetical protein